jgi:hypothetical protein
MLNLYLNLKLIFESKQLTHPRTKYRARSSINKDKDKLS